MAKTIQDFENEARAAGLLIRTLVTNPPRIHRVPTDDKPKRKNGWYILREDATGLHGAYGNWGMGFKATFSSRDWQTLSPPDMELRRAQQREWLAELARMQAEAAERAGADIEDLPDADPNHPYLVRKGIKPNGALQKGDLLVLPLINADGEITTYQTIAPNGDKRFLKDAKKQGSFHVIGQDVPTIICEGFSTGASIHEATGETVAVAIDAGNISHVLRVFSGAVVAGDNDEAGKAAIPPGCKAVFPRDDKDFNDLYARRGAVEVAKYFVENSPENDDFSAPFDLPNNPPETIWPEDAKPNSVTALSNSALVASPAIFFDPTDITPRQWLYGRHLIRKFTSMTVAASGTGKSTLAIADAIGMALGQGLLGQWVHKPLKTWIYNLEDPIEETARRLLAACIHYKIDQKTLAGKLFVNSGRDRDLIIMKPLEGQKGAYAYPDKDALIAAIKAAKIDVLIVDPFVSSYEGDENSNKDVDRAIKAFNAVAEATGCAVELVHHTGKAGGEAGSQSSGRGASAQEGAVRAMRTLTPMTLEESAKFAVDPAERRQYVRLDDGAKANMSKRVENIVWYKLVGVPLGNGTPEYPKGDEVAVFEAWKPTDALADLKLEDIRNCLHRIDQGYGSDRYSIEPRAKLAYVGHVMSEELDLDLVPVKALLGGWIKSGRVYEQEYMSSSRKPRKGVYVNWENFDD